MRTALTLLCLVAFAGSSSAQMNWCENADSFYAEVEGSTITVHHLAALYNCCPDDFDYEVVQQGDVIEIEEAEILTMPCLCLCCFNLSVEIEDVVPGTYDLDLRWYDYESHDWRHWLHEVTVPDVGQTGTLAVVQVTATDCLESSALPDPLEEPEPDASTWGRIRAVYR
jgi:hypothetical protein